MPRFFEVTLRPEEAYDDHAFRPSLFRKLGLADDGSVRIMVARRSIDARGKEVRILHKVEVYERVEPLPGFSYQGSFPDPDPSRPVVVVGAGPAGLFAAIRLLEAGVKPILLERGKDVRTRRRDIAAINKEHTVNPDSNYCFGEGGAGTYSDGKLYTRSGKRGNIRRILEILVAHGAKEEILFDAHPHIGTNRLPALVAAMRETILKAGGEVRFNTLVQDIILEEGSTRGVITASGEPVLAEAVLLAAGHSARDVFGLLKSKNIRIEPKPFALGVRIEHPQALIDSIQYHCSADRGPWLPAASYSLVHQAGGKAGQRGVFSFCMCPGGFMVPSATAPGEVVVNGMSPSRRNSYFANSGIVAAVGAVDFSRYSGAAELAGVEFQSAVEKEACRVAGGRQSAPAQRLTDFLRGKVSSSLPQCSYQPGIISADLGRVLPDFISTALKQGLIDFGRKMPGYVTEEAVLVGVESRTSSPVRIPRHRETCEHTEVARLYPCGEGAGYAGGIVSAAMDGERCAEAIAERYFGKSAASWQK
jgi:hypothetical protein